MTSERKSSRLAEKNQREFRMPSRDERLGDAGTSPGGSTRLSDISPPKRVSNFTRVTHRYNAEAIDVYDSGSDVDDFIDDEDGVEYSGDGSGNESHKDSDEKTGSENSEPPIKKRKKKRYSRITATVSDSESDEESKVQPPARSLDFVGNDRNKDCLASGVANLSCSDDTQMSEPRLIPSQSNNGDSAIELGHSVDNEFVCFSSSGISVGHSPIQALSSDFEDDYGEMSLMAEAEPLPHTVGGALDSDSEVENDSRSFVRKSGAVAVFRHTPCTIDPNENVDPYEFGGLNKYRSDDDKCASLKSGSESERENGELSPSVVAEMSKDFTEDDGVNSSDSDQVFHAVNASRNTSMCINSELEDSDVVTRSGGRKAGGGHGQQIASSDSEADEPIASHRPRSSRALRLSAKKEKLKEETIGAFEEERRRKKKSSLSDQLQ